MTKSRIQENLDIFDFTLDSEDMAALGKVEGECGRYRGGSELSATKHQYYPFHIEF